jgi:hypothetical protein
MILFNNQILFVHNPKTGGTSLLKHLGNILAEPIYYAGVQEIGTYHPSLSRALTYSCTMIGNPVYEFERIISVIRNPYDREISMYVYFRDILCNSKSLSRDLNNPSIERSVRMAGQLSFDDYLVWVDSEFGTCDIWRSKYFYRTDEEHVPATLRILRMEYLENDLADGLRDLKLRSNVATLPRLNVSPRTPADVYREARSVEIVTRSYKWIFESGYYDIQTF